MPRRVRRCETLGCKMTSAIVGETVPRLLLGPSSLWVESSSGFLVALESMQGSDSSQEHRAAAGCVREPRVLCSQIAGQHAPWLRERGGHDFRRFAGARRQ